MKKFALLMGLALMPATAAAHEYQTGDIKIDHPWSRPIGAHASGAGVFMVLNNMGQTADRLVSVSTPIAEMSEIHSMTTDGDVMKMQALPQGIEIPAGGSIALKPGDLHIMLMGPKQPEAKGDHFPMTLTFEKAGPVEINVNVEGVDFKMESKTDHTKD